MEGAPEQHPRFPEGQLRLKSSRDEQTLGNITKNVAKGIHTLVDLIGFERWSISVRPINHVRVPHKARRSQ